MASSEPPSEANSSDTSSEGVDWWIRLERSISLLATMATLAIAGFTWTSITQVNSEQAITREGQITDRYTAAVNNLGNSSQDVRLGGIYALQRLMQDSPRDQPAVIDVISAYVRSHAQQHEAGPKRLTNDVAAALLVLKTRDASHDGAGHVDLTGAALYGAHLGRSHLQGAILQSVDLQNADLRDAVLHDANLSGAELQRANLNGANLTHADLSTADLHSAELTSADLTGASLRDAHMSYANLRSTNLHSAKLSSADLTSAKLSDADLSNADLSIANLSRAYLKGADLTGADLTAANLTSAGVSAQQLLTAQLSEYTQLPSNLANDPQLRKAMRQGS
ncbi:pentapeptide repeat-containing protein [Streptomyces sp. NPDC058304]|uniref:pentapeptide repeat-containing protein n=1 Tax=Streptomyces sp. NPDC058304 TaxID=3346437 RepID=UPI0036E8383E